MVEGEEKPSYAALVALRPDDLALGAWAERAGLARNYFSNLRDHGNPSEDTVGKLLAAIGRSHADYSRLKEIFAGPEVTSITLTDVTRGFGAFPHAPTLDVLGTAIGGEYGDLDELVELTELHLNEVVDRIARPAALMDDENAYAVQIVGESMAPRFKPRERVSVSPKSPVSIGDDVIVQLRGAEGDEERIKVVLIKELVKRTASYVELRQFNPDLTFRIDVKRVARIHRVRGNYF